MVHHTTNSEQRQRAQGLQHNHPHALEFPAGCRRMSKRGDSRWRWPAVRDCTPLPPVPPSAPPGSRAPPWQAPAPLPDAVHRAPVTLGARRLVRPARLRPMTRWRRSGPHCRPAARKPAPGLGRVVRACRAGGAGRCRGRCAAGFMHVAAALAVAKRPTARRRRPDHRLLRAADRGPAAGPRPRSRVPLYALPPALNWPARAPGLHAPADRQPARPRRRRCAGREIAWVADPLDALVLQIQGSGRLRVTEPDGTQRIVRLAFAGHNGHAVQARWAAG